MQKSVCRNPRRLSCAFSADDSTWLENCYLAVAGHTRTRDGAGRFPQKLGPHTSALRVVPLMRAPLSRRPYTHTGRRALTAPHEPQQTRASALRSAASPSRGTAHRRPTGRPRPRLPRPATVALEPRRTNSLGSARSWSDLQTLSETGWRRQRWRGADGVLSETGWRRQRWRGADGGVCFCVTPGAIRRIWTFVYGALRVVILETLLCERLNMFCDGQG